ncbi:hypothetical protein GCM10009799_51790 [Nocardiopsis rhodophaea]|uniref:DUF6545 domain-containing protein n=1 Tax=Nocardiopsis rhodophaea TaxID=280238 RepID=A0ABN2TRX7_9ACTN
MDSTRLALTVEVVTVILLWAAAIWWWSRRTKGHGWLCTALTAYAFTATIRIPPLYMGAEALIGVPLVATLLIQVGQVVILAAMWEALSTRISQGRADLFRCWRITAAALTLFSMSALFLLGYLTQQEQWPATDFELRFALGPAPLVGFLWIYGIYDAVALLACIVLSLKQASLAQLWSARIGLALTCVAYTSALVLHTWTMLVYAGAFEEQKMLVQYAGNIIIKGGFLLVIMGMSAPGLTAALTRKIVTWRQKRDHRRLEPFWLRLSEADPDIVLLPPRSLPDPWTQLYRRTIETWDGILALARWGADDLELQAQRHCPPLWRRPRRRYEAALAAICIEAAIQRRAAGFTGSSEPKKLWQSSKSRSFDAELKWLVAVSRAWASPSVRRAATGLAQESAPFVSADRPSHPAP